MKPVPWQRGPRIRPPPASAAGARRELQEAEREILPTCTRRSHGAARREAFLHSRCSGALHVDEFDDYDAAESRRRSSGRAISSRPEVRVERRLLDSWPRVARSYYTSTDTRASCGLSRTRRRRAASRRAVVAHELVPIWKRDKIGTSSRKSFTLFTTRAHRSQNAMACSWMCCVSTSISPMSGRKRSRMCSPPVTTLCRYAGPFSSLAGPSMPSKLEDVFQVPLHLLEQRPMPRSVDEAMPSGTLRWTITSRSSFLSLALEPPRDPAAARF